MVLGRSVRSLDRVLRLTRVTHMNEQRKLSTLEKVAAGVSAVVLVAIVIYWITQIAGVIEMLKLAYG
jgi:hypothetical protein